ncbi:MAG: patatin-like phospholipase family protein [Desulfobacterales bacterium]|nr:patatin-like phospholipase family protein [Desulfobacterales bacterium]MDJ0884626.1 patatin-like phospholipase family protein [Desulfobacterales bacterium]
MKQTWREIFRKSDVESFEKVWEEERTLLDIEDPHAARGLALSGGGIRSASFGLGVIQALLEHRVMGRIDYLSTVSGGGYIGAALTWFRKFNAGSGITSASGGFFNDADPFGEKGKGVRSSDKPNFLSYLRQHSNYLNPNRLLGILSAVSVAIRNLVISLLIYSALLVFLLSLLMIAEHYIANFLPKSVHNAVDYLLALGSIDQAEWASHSFFQINMLFGLVFVAILVGHGLYFSISTFFTPFCEGRHSFSSYGNRNAFQVGSGIFLKLVICFSFLAALPAANEYLTRWLAASENELKTILAVGTAGTVSGAWAAFSKFRTFLGKTGLFNKVPWIGERFFGLGALLFLFGMAVVFYRVALLIGIPTCAMMPIDASVWHYLWWIGGGALAFALVVNINYASLGRMYRDRLMETFLPDESAVADNRWRPARRANRELLENMCREKGGRIRKPLHLINTNVILGNSNQKKFRRRGGDSFLLSPLYCGADSTRFICTSAFLKFLFQKNSGLKLANAMAISGAAANPHTGVGGKGPTRGALVSILMTMFNLRLGSWVTNPSKQNRLLNLLMNYISPGIGSLFLFGHKETSRYLELTDGGHFENLGLYELIRRRVGTIIVSDAGVDKHFKFGDLANAIEKVRTDFGVSIRFAPEDIALHALLPGSAQKDNATKAVELLDNLAEKGYILGKIIYPATVHHARFTGRIILLKTTMTPNLPADLYSYRANHPDFPDQPTSDQFFDERQFEAYRELGYRVADDMCVNYRDIL